MGLSGKIKRVFTSTRDYFAGGAGEHSFRSMVAAVRPDAPASWRLARYLDLLCAELYCPGLDAMDYFLYHFEGMPNRERKTYITEGGLKKMVRHFNGTSADPVWKSVEYKPEFNRLFADLLGREWILNDTEERLVTFCTGKKRIVKPAGGVQGKGIFITEKLTEEESRKLYRSLQEENYVIEELLTQHKDLAALNPSSVNTLRIYTVADKEGSRITVSGAVLRIGRSGRVVDNWHAGGMAAEVDTDTGIVSSPAVDGKGGEYSTHPDTGAQITGFCVPAWEEAFRIVKLAHSRIKGLRYVGWDVVIGENEEAFLLEGNLFGGVHLQQQPCRKGKKELYLKLWD